MKKGYMLEKMLHLMVSAHSGQFDRGGQPYALHPLAVMQMTKSKDEEIQCIALGHDVIEDTKITFQDLREQGMSERIIEGIRALTKMPGQTYDEYKKVVFANRDAMIVKMADLRHNTDIRRLKGVTEKDLARMAKYQMFYLELKARLEAWGNGSGTN